MKRVSSEAEYCKQWTEAGISQAAIDKIKPLVGKRHYIQLAPDYDGELWSRWGGTPWLPDSVAAPPDRFLCQIAIHEIPDGPTRSRLPNSGFLYFFIHPKGRDKGMVLFTKEAPDSPPANAKRSTAIQLISHSMFLFPEYESDEFDELDLDEDGNAYMDWEEDYLEGAFTQIEEGNVLLGGWTEASEKCAKELKNRAGANWDLLLSLDPHENAPVQNSALGDIPFLNQRLFYFIKADDLKAGNFENIQSRYGAS